MELLGPSGLLCHWRYTIGRSPLAHRLANRFQRLHDGELVELTPVEQELTRPFGLVVHPVAVAVGRDVAIDKRRLTPGDLDVRIAEVETPITHGLDLRAKQADPGLEAIENLVLEERLAVGHERSIALHFLGHACR